MELAALSNSVNQQRSYPTHDPSLEPALALDSGIVPAQASSDMGIEVVDPARTEEVCTSNSPQVGALASDGGIVPDQASIDMDIEVVDPARTEEVHTSNSPPAGSHNHTNPKRIAYLLGMYPAFWGVIKLLKREDHTPFTTISDVTYAIAFLDLCILACMYEFYGSSNLSHPNVNLCWYKILQVVYYILCFLAILLLLPLFF